MSPSFQSGPGLAVASAMAAGVLAVAVALGLSALAKPADLAQRRAALNQKIQRIETLSKISGGPGSLPKGAVCQGDLSEGGQQIEQSLRSSAQGAFELTDLSFAPLPQSDGLAIRAGTVRFQATGGYEQVLGLLKSLEGARPLVFADTVDLVSNTSAVTLQFSGRFYCSTSASQ